MSTGEGNVSAYGTHLSTNRATDINKLDVGELPLDLLNLWIRNCPANYTLQGSNRVTEVGGLEGLRGLTDRALLESERNKGSRANS